MFGFFKRIERLEDRVQELEVKVCNLNRLTKHNDQDIDDLVETLDVIDDTMDSLAQALLASLKEKMPKKKPAMSSNAMKVMKSGAKKGTIVWAPEKKKTRFNGKEFEEANGSWVMVAPKKKAGRPRKTK